MMKLTNENYYSPQANMEYMSCSQFKDFLKCQTEALDKLIGNIEEEKTDALLFGGYVDAYFSNELEQYKIDNPSMFLKNGELKASFKNVDEVIRAFEEDQLLYEAVSGEHQVIMTGFIANVPFKIKIDSYHEGECIVDQKVMKDLSLIWNEEKHKKVDFIENYGYDLQGAIYQEIVRQNTGLKLPFVLAVATKEECPDKALIEIDQKYLDKALRLVEQLAPVFQAVKEGDEKPCRCGKCPSCRRIKKLDRIVRYSEFFGKEDEE